MREILFRGKRIDNGEWMYGLLDNEEHDADFTAILPHRNERGKYDDWAVDPSTVGQYTGLTDKNGNRIFEGDIVKHDFGEDQIGVQYAVVKYDGKYASFMIEPLYDWMPCDKEDCEVIGNIHDNPELLEEETT